VTLALAVTAPVLAANHVRVVLDVSKSMRKNDPGRQAILATLLLHDLADPDASRQDSFEVIPFHPTQKWKDPSDPPPEEIGKVLRPKDGDRETFVRELSGLPYDADWTYFYPGIRAAAEALQSTSGGAYDTRAVILVTDGVPEDPTRDEELRRIRSELIPELERHGIRLYVLAFGHSAYDHRAFFDRMIEGSSGGPLGEVFVDRDGSDLLTPMTRIFSRSFGYDDSPPRPAASVSNLDLEAGASPRRVAVVVLSGEPSAPRLTLAAPAGVGLNAPEPVKSAEVAGGGYALRWVLSPAPGNHPFDTDALRGKVAVLRPARLRIEVRPATFFSQTGRTMAETPFPLAVLVRPQGGGDPGPVDLSFRVHGQCRTDPATGGLVTAWSGRPSAPPPGPGTATADGRRYEIEPEFPADRERGGFYRGCLEIEARRHEAVVGSLTGRHAHYVEVHPLLAVSPVPSTADAVVGDEDDARQRALHRRETACARFELALDAGELPHPERPRYPVRVVLDPSIDLSGPLREASVTLDGLPLEIEGKPGPNPGPWYNGRQLDAEELLGEHRACLHLGRPESGDPAKPLALPIRWTLLETPYDDFRVVRPFTLEALVAPPGRLEKWHSPLVLGLVSLVLLGTLWHLRDRPVLPRDLRAAIAPEGGGPPEARHLEESSPLARWLGLVAEKAITAPGSDRPLAWVRPGGKDLFVVRPARRDATIRPAGGGESSEARGNQITLAVHRPYRLEGPDGSYLFRLEYR
jgi:hypothetical protein